MDKAEMNSLFAQIKTRYEPRNGYGLICKHGSFNDCCVLKLLRPSWTNDTMDRIENRSGIFFSVWSSPESRKKNQILYNIHALKLRELKGYSISSRNFAREFRERFEPTRDTWPNVRVDFGPATLMQGWIGNEPALVEENILSLMQQFGGLSPVIDDLLESHRR